MKIFSLICLIVGLMTCNVTFGAKLVGKDYPYYIFEDKGKIRYCLDPNPDYPSTPCWSNGIKTDCTVLPSEAGYIDCEEQPIIKEEG